MPIQIHKLEEYVGTTSEKVQKYLIRIGWIKSGICCTVCNSSVYVSDGNTITIPVDNMCGELDSVIERLARTLNLGIQALLREINKP